MFETLLENIKFFLIDYFGWFFSFGDGGVAVDVQVVVRRFVYNNVFISNYILRDLRFHD
jgi:hypothetical protein